MASSAQTVTLPDQELIAATPKSSRPLIWIIIAVVVLVFVGGFVLLKRFGELRRQQTELIDTKLKSTSVVATHPKLEPEPDLWNGLKPGPVTIEKSPKSRLIYAVATIRNDTDKQRFGVKVTLDILDAQGEKLGTTTDYAQFIDAHKEWTFRALVAFPKAAAAKVASITEG